MKQEHTNLGTTYQALKLYRLIVEPNSSFLRQLRQLENELSLPPTEKKFTLLDEPEAEVDESLSLLLQWASLKATNANAADPLSLMDEFVNSLLQLADEKKAAKVHTFICSIFDAYGSDSDRDSQARSILPVAMNLLVKTDFMKSDELQTVISETVDCDAWDELDLPHGRKYLEQLLKKFVKYQPSA